MPCNYCVLRAQDPQWKHVPAPPESGQCLGGRSAHRSLRGVLRPSSRCFAGSPTVGLWLRVSYVSAICLMGQFPRVAAKKGQESVHCAVISFCLWKYILLQVEQAEKQVINYSSLYKVNIFTGFLWHNNPNRLWSLTSTPLASQAVNPRRIPPQCHLTPTSPVSPAPARVKRWGSSSQRRAAL